LDSFPNLKIVVSHGGGYMPFYIGRIARNYIEKPATRINMSKPPIEYVRMLYYDTCVYDPETLARLVQIVGPQHVVMGSDYPVGDASPVDTVREIAGLDDAGRKAVLNDNAARLLRMAR
jgi:aminocarboxymuconate-semialdehyde decarboxylase